MLPGGGPQGAYLGGLIFILKYNGAFLRPPVPRPIQGPVLKAKSEKVKYVDAGTVAVSVDLKASLIPDPKDRAKPLNFHERTGHVLPVENNLLQYYVTDTEQFAAENKIVINKQKTKIISFTKSRKGDFPPELHFSDGSIIEYMAETKLVGVMVSQDLRWQKNTEYICEKARSKLWILRRVLTLNLDIHEMFDIYIKEVRSILELAVPVWHPGLTKQQSLDIERIQKVAFKIILKEKYSNYDMACKWFSAQTRRNQLCLKFGRKNLKSENSMFTPIKTNMQTRSRGDLVQEFLCNTQRFQKSSLPYLAKLINANNRK
jgi:hypothetical protein